MGIKSLIMFGDGSTQGFEQCLDANGVVAESFCDVAPRIQRRTVRFRDTHAFPSGHVLDFDVTLSSVQQNPERRSQVQNCGALIESLFAGTPGQPEIVQRLLQSRQLLGLDPCGPLGSSVNFHLAEEASQAVASGRITLDGVELPVNSVDGQISFSEIDSMLTAPPPE